MYIDTICISVQGPFDDLPFNEKYVGWFNNPEYRGMVVTADSPASILMELSISLSALEQYKRKNPGK